MGPGSGDRGGQKYEGGPLKQLFGSPENLNFTTAMLSPALRGCRGETGTAANRPTSPGPFAAITGLDPKASGPPGRGTTPRECRSVPSRHEIGGATAVRSQSWLTNRVCHAGCRPRPQSPSTSECATVFGQLEMLSGKYRLIKWVACE